MEGVAVAESIGRGWTVESRGLIGVMSKAPPSSSPLFGTMPLPPQAEGELRAG